MDITGLAHMALIVSIQGKRYLTDVGFGGNGLAGPIELSEGVIVDTMPNEQHRLARLPIPGAVLDTQYWHLQHAVVSQQQHWHTVYIFDADREFFRRDYEVLNWFTSTHNESLFTNFVICILLTQQNDKAHGRLILHGNTLKERVNGKGRTITTFNNENARMQCLEKYFHITLSAQEVGAIRGTRTALKEVVTT